MLPRDEEFRLYVVVLLLGVVVLAAELWSEDIETGEGAIRHAVFQTASDDDHDRLRHRRTTRCGRRSP